MDVVALLAILATGLLTILFVVKKQSGFKSHVQQLQPKPKRKLQVGTWTREEVAKHNSLDDLWLIIKSKTGGVYKVRDAGVSADGGRSWDTAAVRGPAVDGTPISQLWDTVWGDTAAALTPLLHAAGVRPDRLCAGAPRR